MRAHRWRPLRAAIPGDTPAALLRSACAVALWRRCVRALLPGPREPDPQPRRPPSPPGNATPPENRVPAASPQRQRHHHLRYTQNIATFATLRTHETMVCAHYEMGKGPDTTFPLFVVRLPALSLPPHLSLLC